MITDLIEEYMLEPDDSIGRDILVHTLKTRYPGDYEVLFSETNRGLVITIEFRDSEEMTLFRIKGWM